MLSLGSTRYANKPRLYSTHELGHTVLCIARKYGIHPQLPTTNLRVDAALQLLSGLRGSESESQRDASCSTPGLRSTL
jgi:hypothetical protein